MARGLRRSGLSSANLRWANLQLDLRWANLRWDTVGCLSTGLSDAKPRKPGAVPRRTPAVPPGVLAVPPSTPSLPPICLAVPPEVLAVRTSTRAVPPGVLAVRTSIPAMPPGVLGVQTSIPAVSPRSPSALASRRVDKAIRCVCSGLPRSKQANSFQAHQNRLRRFRPRWRGSRGTPETDRGQALEPPVPGCPLQAVSS